MCHWCWGWETRWSMKCPLPVRHTECIWTKQPEAIVCFQLGTPASWAPWVMAPRSVSLTSISLKWHVPHYLQSCSSACPTISSHETCSEWDPSSPLTSGSSLPSTLRCRCLPTPPADSYSLPPQASWLCGELWQDHRVSLLHLFVPCMLCLSSCARYYSHRIIIWLLP